MFCIVRHVNPSFSFNGEASDDDDYGRDNVEKQWESILMSSKSDLSFLSVVFLCASSSLPSSVEQFRQWSEKGDKVKVRFARLNNLPVVL
jgi:hypothetical protein